MVRVGTGTFVETESRSSRRPGAAARGVVQGFHSCVLLRELRSPQVSALAYAEKHKILQPAVQLSETEVAIPWLMVTTSVTISVFAVCGTHGPRSTTRSGPLPTVRTTVSLPCLLSPFCPRLFHLLSTTALSCHPAQLSSHLVSPWPWSQLPPIRGSHYCSSEAAVPPPM